MRLYIYLLHFLKLNVPIFPIKKTYLCPKIFPKNSRLQQLTIPSNMNPEITDYYNTIANDYDKSRFATSYGKYIHAQESFYLQKYFPKTSKSLSLGCGTGRYMEMASVGLDISVNMLKIAQKNYPNKQFLQGDATHTGLDSGYFEGIFSLHVLMHLDEEVAQAIFKEVARILAPKGSFIFDIPSAHRRSLSKHKAENWHAAQAFSLPQIKQLLGDDFTIQQYYGILFFPIHRFPQWLRTLLLPIDNLLCRSFLKKYASYLLFIVEKNEKTA